MVCVFLGTTAPAVMRRVGGVYVVVWLGILNWFIAWEALRLEDWGVLRGVGSDSAKVSIDECT